MTVGRGEKGSTREAQGTGGGDISSWAGSGSSALYRHRLPHDPPSDLVKVVVLPADPRWRKALVGSQRALCHPLQHEPVRITAAHKALQASGTELPAADL